MSHPLELLIVTYHHVGEPHPKARYRGLYVTPDCLKAHVLGLKKAGYGFITLRDALAKNSGRWAVITFDDGYRDNLTLGLPVLQGLEVPATIFVVTGAVGKTQHSFPEAGDQSKHDFLDWDEIMTLHKAGWEIGSHSHSHVHFGRRTLEQQEEELAASDRVLRDRLGVEPVAFAFPFGSMNDQSPAALQKSAFRCAVTTETGVNLSLASPYLLNRVSLRGYRFWHRWHYRKALRVAAGGRL